MTKQELIREHNQKVKDIRTEEIDRKVVSIIIILSVGYFIIHFIIYLSRI